MADLPKTAQGEQVGELLWDWLPHAWDFDTEELPVVTLTDEELDGSAESTDDNKPADELIPLVMARVVIDTSKLADETGLDIRFAPEENDIIPPRMLKHNGAVYQTVQMVVGRDEGHVLDAEERVLATAHYESGAAELRAMSRVALRTYRLTEDGKSELKLDFNPYPGLGLDLGLDPIENPDRAAALLPGLESVRLYPPELIIDPQHRQSAGHSTEPAFQGLDVVTSEAAVAQDRMSFHAFQRLMGRTKHVLQGIPGFRKPVEIRDDSDLRFIVGGDAAQLEAMQRVYEIQKRAGPRPRTMTWGRFWRRVAGLVPFTGLGGGIGSDIDWSVDGSVRSGRQL